MLLARTNGIDIDSWYRHGLMLYTWTHGIDMDSWYRHGLMVVTTPMVLTQTHGIVLVLLNHTCTRGPSVARMRDFLELKRYFLVEIESYVAICLHLIGFYPHFGCISRRALVRFQIFLSLCCCCRISP